MRFQEILAYERQRAERSGLPFAMIAIDMDVEHEASTAIVVERILDRVRAIDEVGRLEDGRLGIITPYTDGRGASRLAEQLFSMFPSEFADAEIKIYEYEASLISRFDDAETAPGCDRERRSADHQREALPEALSIDRLFVRASPIMKRSIDLIGASTGLILLSPLILIVACAIKLSSPGPVFFVQRRTGLGGQDFPMFKFRTMVHDAESKRNQLAALNEQDGPAFKIGNDPRITPIGHLLRRLSLDELPQLLNVLRGEMSLVGPRPLPTSEAAECQPWQRRRGDVTPGMTCTWQVLDRTTMVPFDDWMRMDVQYAEKRSLKTDFILLAKTLLFVIGLRGR